MLNEVQPQCPVKDDVRNFSGTGGGRAKKAKDAQYLIMDGRQYSRLLSYAKNLQSGEINDVNEINEHNINEWNINKWNIEWHLKD